MLPNLLWPQRSGIHTTPFEFVPLIRIGTSPPAVEESWRQTHSVTFLLSWAFIHKQSRHRILVPRTLWCLSKGREGGGLDGGASEMLSLERGQHSRDHCPPQTQFSQHLWVPVMCQAQW